MVGSTVSVIGHELETVPFTNRCRSIWERGDHALIGVSPGNSYFSRHRLAALACWADRFFESIDIVYADMHLEAVLTAIGYTPGHARRKSRKELEGVRRRIRRAMEQLECTAARIGVSALSDFLSTPAYRDLHRTVEQSVRSDDVLRSACEKMVDQFIAGKIPGGSRPTPEQHRSGMDYLLAEMPFFVDTPSILGVGSSASCYHTLMPLTPVLFSSREGLRAVDNQGYLLVRPPGIPGQRDPGENTAAEGDLHS
ncbi:tRNA-dependent cyclodipeptide synthase [Saccharopolyspora erythraea]|uniref:tRNA-dependent cyclodipeptide synthase n=1 Tax=Saccharopolyspora erythraea TaxID=1836 RepID=UPI001BA8A551|nr:tRNA-dependent cyclodipeptide synthase [Saccharopolyspora erythraea]QUH04094.1 tRNA-dependent cyclodipeptide synthase [Saccharopolyspora erythraea]